MPARGWGIGVNLNPIAFRIGKVNRLTHHMIGSALHGHAIGHGEGQPGTE
jgi:hypothetical protein